MCYQSFRSTIEYKTPFSGAFYTARTIYTAFLLYKTIAVGSEIRKQVKRKGADCLNKSKLIIEIFREMLLGH